MPISTSLGQIQSAVDTKKTREEWAAIKRTEGQRRAKRRAEAAGNVYVSPEERQRIAAERKADQAERSATWKAKQHGMSGTREYRSWRAARHRCTTPHSKYYYCYGGRGITMCDKWMNDFLAFYQYVVGHFGLCPEGYSPDRVDTNGNYEPSNVRWWPDELQSGNRRPSSEWRVHPSVSGRKGHEIRLAARLYAAADIASPPLADMEVYPLESAEIGMLE